jgi:hypothetical protein
MVTFQEKLDHACRAFSVTMDEVCKATKISPFCIQLHATGQRDLSHNDMVLLCQYFDITGDYFTNNNIRYIDTDTLPDEVRELLSESEVKNRILCYCVANDDVPDMTPKELKDLLKLLEDNKNE